MRESSTRLTNFLMNFSSDEYALLLRFKAGINDNVFFRQPLFQFIKSGSLSILTRSADDEIFSAFNKAADDFHFITYIDHIVNFRNA